MQFHKTELGSRNKSGRLKILKYKDLYNSNTAHVELKIDTSNNRGNWNHPNSFRKYLTNTASKLDIKELNKTGILVTAHILQTAQNIYYGKQHCIYHKF